MNTVTEQTLIAELRLPAHSDRLKLVRSVVEQAAQLSGCDANLTERLVLAINEACMNIIQHGYHYDPQGEIILQIANNDGALVFRLTDFAASVDPRQLQPRNLTEVRPGGLGLNMMHEVMDEIRYLSPPSADSGNRLQLTKRLR